jgi:hypothetical protein
MKHLPNVKITAKELQRKFNSNEGGYPAKIRSLRTRCIYDKPASPKSRQPPDTRSQVHEYFDGCLSVMIVHYFVLPSGKLGASGMMDPKRLLVDGIYYFCD